MSNPSPTRYKLDLEMKASIAYDYLCENYGSKFIDDLLGYIKMERIKLADDLEVKRLLDLINNIG